MQSIHIYFASEKIWVTVKIVLVSLSSCSYSPEKSRFERFEARCQSQNDTTTNKVTRLESSFKTSKTAAREDRKKLAVFQSKLTGVEKYSQDSLARVVTVEVTHREQTTKMGALEDQLQQQLELVKSVMTLG